MKNIFKYLTGTLALVVLTVYSPRLSAQTERFNVDSIKALVKQLSSDTGQVKAYIDMASVIYCEDSASKVIIANEAKKLAEKINWREGIYKANRKLGDIYFTCLKNYPKAFQALEDNVTYANKLNDTVNEAISLETIAKAYQKLTQYTKALEYYNKVLALKPSIDMQIGVMGDKGVVYKTIGENTDALFSYKSSLEMLDSVNRKKNNKDIQDTLQTAGLLLNIGDIYMSMSKPEQAYDYYSKVLKLSNGMKDLYFQIASLTGIGKTFKLKANYPKAIEHFQLALLKCREINEFREEVKILDELANTYLETYVYPKALLYSDTSLRLAEDQSYIDLLPRSYITLGNIFIKQLKYDLAIPSLQKALNIAQNNRDLESAKNAWYALNLAYEGNGQFHEALIAHRSYIAAKDTLYNIEKANEFTRKELEINFKYQQKIDGIEFDKTIERQKRFTYTSIAGLFLVVLLAFFVYRNYNTQKKYNALLSKEKKSHLAHIEAQSNVLSDIAYTQAHHVRGPLSTMMGLIQLFNTDDPSDPVNKEVINGLTVVTEKLDKVVKDVISKENDIRYDNSNDTDL